MDSSPSAIRPASVRNEFTCDETTCNQTGERMNATSRNDADSFRISVRTPLIAGFCKPAGMPTRKSQPSVSERADAG